MDSEAATAKKLVTTTKIAYKKVTTWLGELHRGGQDTDEMEVFGDDVGTVSFKVRGKQYSVPFTGLLRLIEVGEVHAPNDDSELKMMVEEESGRVADFADKLELLAEFMNEGAALFRAAGMHKLPEGDEEDSEEDEEE